MECVITEPPVCITFCWKMIGMFVSYGLNFHLQRESMNERHVNAGRRRVMWTVLLAFLYIYIFYILNISYWSVYEMTRLKVESWKGFLSLLDYLSNKQYFLLKTCISKVTYSNTGSCFFIGFTWHLGPSNSYSLFKNHKQ